MANELAELIALGKQNAEGLAVVTKSFNALVDKMNRTPAYGHPSASEVFGLPFIRKGEDPMGSRGYSFMKMLGVITGAINQDQAKIEIDIHRKLDTAFNGNLVGVPGYEYKGTGYAGQTKFLAPLSSSFFQEDAINRNARMEMKALVIHGMDGADPNEMAWIRQKMMAAKGYGTKALSWLNEFTGGALVAPPGDG